MMVNEYEHDLRMDEIEYDLGELLLELQKVLRAIHLANCATCRAQGQSDPQRRGSHPQQGVGGAWLLDRQCNRDGGRALDYAGDAR